jgi:hypothetical protein
MQSLQPLSAIPDDDLLRRLADLIRESRRTEADLVAYMAEVDARRLYAREATPSMFVYCVERLHLSEAEACLRIAAARASREHPIVLEMLADGRLHLSAIAKLAPHLTPDNREDVLRRATHKTKREIEELVAELAPRPDVPDAIRKLPAGRFVARPVGTRQGDHRNPPASGLQPNGTELDVGNLPSGGPMALPCPDRAAGGESSLVRSFGEMGTTSGLRPERVDSHRLDGVARWAASSTSAPSVIEPLAPARYRVQFTASAELRDKLERLQTLMRSTVSGGDLAAVIDAAVTEKLERLEARRFGRTKTPRKSAPASDTSPRTRNVPAAVRRAVHERDEGRCRYVDAHGRRCTARGQVQYHHRVPFGVGGNHAPANMSLLCPAHNRQLAEIDFGRGAVGSHRRTSGPAPLLALSLE